MIIIIFIVIFSFLATLYYFVGFQVNEFSNLFLSISTFLFATFTGFFISRQGKRYSNIRDQIATFDGMLSATYRHYQYFGKMIQEKVKKIISEHYKKILKNNSWDYHFVHKSSTITELTQLLVDVGKKKDNGSGISVSLIREGARIVRDLQIIRKKMILLHQERIPKFQWSLLIFLAIILLVSVSMIPSQGETMASILKGAFGTSVVLVLVLLKRLDSLSFFEKTIGESSAEDILEIFKNKK